MPRPAKSATKSKAVAPKTTAASKASVMTDGAQEAFDALKAHFTEGGEQVVTIMTDLLEELEALAVAIGATNGKAPTKASKPETVVTKPGNLAKTKAAPVDDEGEYDAPEFEDMGVSSLQEMIDKYRLDVDLSEIKGLANKQAAVQEAYEDQVGEGSTVGDAPEFDEMDAKELQAFIEDNDLNVDLSEYKGLAKKQAAVQEAYEEAGDGGTVTKGADDEEDDNSW